jgi:hypothetical protein
VSPTLASVRSLVSRGDVVISLHAYDEMVADGITTDEILVGLVTLSSSKTTLMRREVRLSWSYRRTTTVYLFMLFGVSRKTQQGLLW